MVDDDGSGLPDEAIAETTISTRSGISLIWLVPLVAILVGGWILYESYADKGPTITIELKEAAGVTAEKTMVRFRDVDIGKVIKVDLNADLTGVTITAELQHGSERLLGAATRLWVEQPEISLTGIRGLQTMLSGVYIGIDPDIEGPLTRHFVGLDEAPFINGAQDGRYYVVQLPSRGSFNRGAPVLFRGYKVGQVVRDDLSPDTNHVDVKIFVEAPHYQRITTATRFWNESGIDVEMSADGFQVHSKALVNILLGGISFGNPPDRPAGEPADETTEFTLYESRALAFAPHYRKLHAVVYFNSSVRGLTVGAPVEFRGVQVGEVTDVHLEFEAADFGMLIPVRIALEPARLMIVGTPDAATAKSQAQGGADNLRRLVEVGMRAQIKTGSLLTGAKLIDFDIYADAAPASMELQDGVPVLPTIPTILDSMTEKVTGILDKIEKLPLEELSQDLRGTVQAAHRLIDNADIGAALQAMTEALDEAKLFAKQLNTDIGPRATTTLEQADDFAENLNTTIAPRLDDTLRELKDAARAIRVMSDYLERHPDALLKGKKP